MVCTFNKNDYVYEISISDPLNIQNPDRHVFDMIWYDPSSLILLERSRQLQNVILQKYTISENGVEDCGNLLSGYPIDGICNRITKSMYLYLSSIPPLQSR